MTPDEVAASITQRMSDTMRKQEGPYAVKPDTSVVYLTEVVSPTERALFRVEVKRVT